MYKRVVESSCLGTFTQNRVTQGKTQPESHCRTTRGNLEHGRDLAKAQPGFRTTVAQSMPGSDGTKSSLDI